jgi:hypothetical protein
MQIVEEDYPMKKIKSTFLKIIIFLCVLSGDLGYAPAQSVYNTTERSLGKVDFSISCTTEAQTKFNKALALLHNMMYLQAEKEFKAVAELDPDCAMAYWGIAMTLFHPLWAPPKEHELKSGSEAAQKSASLKPPTKREQAYIAAVNAFYMNWESTAHPARLVQDSCLKKCERRPPSILGFSTTPYMHTTIQSLQAAHLK